MSDTSEPIYPGAALPDGDYAIVELLGHRTLIGRIAEIERFGTKFLQVEPIYRGALLGPILQGGGSIYAFTPCSKEVASRQAPDEWWQLPGPIKAMLPLEALPPPFEGVPFADADDGLLEDRFLDGEVLS